MNEQANGELPRVDPNQTPGYEGWQDHGGMSAWLDDAVDNSPEACAARVAEHRAQQLACTHDWTEYWDGSLGHRRTDQCMLCFAYRPTPPRAVRGVRLTERE